MGLGPFWRSVVSSLGNVWITGRRAEFVGALLGRTICDHPLKSLLIYCGCLFSESPGLSLGTASILISQLGLSCFCKEKAICEMKWQRIKRENVRETKKEEGGGGSGQILHWIYCSSDILVCDTLCEEADWMSLEIPHLFFIYVLHFVAADNGSGWYFVVPLFL